MNLMSMKPRAQKGRQHFSSILQIVSTVSSPAFVLPTHQMRKFIGSAVLIVHAIWWYLGHSRHSSMPYPLFLFHMDLWVQCNQTKVNADHSYNV